MVGYCFGCFSLAHYLFIYLYTLPFKPGWMTSLFVWVSFMVSGSPCVSHTSSSGARSGASLHSVASHSNFISRQCYLKGHLDFIEINCVPNTNHSNVIFTVSHDIAWEVASLWSHVRSVAIQRGKHERLRRGQWCRSDILQLSTARHQLVLRNLAVQKATETRTDWQGETRWVQPSIGIHIKLWAAATTRCTRTDMHVRFHRITLSIFHSLNKHPCFSLQWSLKMTE